MVTKKIKVPCDAGHRSAGHSFGDYNQKELLRGMKIEFEHTRDPDVAKRISADHLTEGSNYYELLDQMEKKLKNPIDVKPGVSKRCVPKNKRPNKKSEITSLTAVRVMKPVSRFDDIIR